MGGRYDATNVIPSPVACGVALLDLDHTQVSQNDVVFAACLPLRGCSARKTSSYLLVFDHFHPYSLWNRRRESLTGMQRNEVDA